MNIHCSCGTVVWPSAALAICDWQTVSISWSLHCFILFVESCSGERVPFPSCTANSAQAFGIEYLMTFAPWKQLIACKMLPSTSFLWLWICAHVLFDCSLSVIKKNFLLKTTQFIPFQLPSNSQVVFVYEFMDENFINLKSCHWGRQPISAMAHTHIAYYRGLHITCAPARKGIINLKKAGSGGTVAQSLKWYITQCTWDSDAVPFFLFLLC